MVTNTRYGVVVQCEVQGIVGAVIPCKFDLKFVCEAEGCARTLSIPITWSTSGTFNKSQMCSCGKRIVISDRCVEEAEAFLLAAAGEEDEDAPKVGSENVRGCFSVGGDFYLLQDVLCGAGIEWKTNFGDLMITFTTKVNGYWDDTLGFKIKRENEEDEVVKAKGELDEDVDVSENFVRGLQLFIVKEQPPAGHE